MSKELKKRIRISYEYLTGSDFEGSETWVTDSKYPLGKDYDTINETIMSHELSNAVNIIMSYMVQNGCFQLNVDIDEFANAMRKNGDDK